ELSLACRFWQQESRHAANDDSGSSVAAVAMTLGARSRSTSGTGPDVRACYEEDCMKRHMITALALAVLTAGVVYAQHVTTDSDPAAPFATYKTYAWTPGTASA